LLEKNKIIQKGNGNIVIKDSVIIMGESSSHSEDFLEELEEDFQEQFYETKFYKNVLNYFENNSIAVLLGIPGIGKSFTSKMVCYEYKTRGYKIRYSDDFNENNRASEFIEFISNHPSEHIFILLDDFLGLAYEEIISGRDKEIAKLINKVKRESNRVKLLINSRAKVYNEFMSKNERTPQAIESSMTYEIMVDSLDISDRAGIFYNHLRKALKQNRISQEHYCALLKENNFLKIIQNDKFNPRVIEFVTIGLKDVNEISPENYAEYITENLENPDQIWDREIMRLQEIDRVLIYTLYSLTKTTIEIDRLQQCFEKRIQEDQSLIYDTTILQFKAVTDRLLNSIIKIDKHYKKVGVINPSINDWIKKNLMSNCEQINKIITHAAYYDQIECFDSTDCYKSPLIELINKNKLSQLCTLPTPILDGAIEHATPTYLYLSKVLLWKLDETDLAKIGLDTEWVQSFITKKVLSEDNFHLVESEARLYNPLKSTEIFCKLFSDPLIDKYDLSEVICNENYLEVILNSVARDETYFHILTNISNKYGGCFEDDFYSLPQVKYASLSNLSNHITGEVYDGVVSDIMESAANNIDEYAGCDFNDFVDCIYDEIIDEVESMISSAIAEKLNKEQIDWLNIDDFDLDDIINDELYLDELIRSKCSIYVESDEPEYSDEQSYEQKIDDIINLFGKGL